MTVVPSTAAPRAPQPGNTIVPVPESPDQGGPPSLVVPPAGSPALAVGGAKKPLDWRWVAALLFLWLGLTAVYELGAPKLANGFALLIAFGSVLVLGPAAMAEIITLIGG